MMGDESNWKKEKESMVNNPWITGGTLGSRSCVLQFRCSALSKAPAAPPGDILHMTYKTYQAETKLLAAVLNAHGLREMLGKLVKKWFIHRRLLQLTITAAFCYFTMVWFTVTMRELDEGIVANSCNFLQVYNLCYKYEKIG